MNKTKRNIFLFIFFTSIALIGWLNISRILKEEIQFYDSAIIQSIKIDSISFISSDPSYGIYGIIGYGVLNPNKKNISVDMTFGVNINSFSISEANDFKGQIVEIYLNHKFEQARLKTKDKSEIDSLNKRNMFLYSFCFLPLIILVVLWVIQIKLKK